MVSCFTFRSLNRFEFLYMVWGSVLISLIYTRLSSFPNTTYWRDYLFSIVYFWVLALAMKLRELESTWHTWWKIPCELGVSWPGPECRRSWAGGPRVLLREAFFCRKMLLLVLTIGMAKLASPLQEKEKPLVRDKSPGYKRVSGEGWAVPAIPSCWDVTPHSGSEMGSRVGNPESPTTLL